MGARTWRHISTRWPWAARLFLAGAVGLMCGTGVYTFHFAEGASYLSNDPQACVNCHIMREQYDGWVHSSHHAHATCNDCHLPHDFAGKWATKADNGFWHSFYFTFNNYHDPIQIRPRNKAVLNQACLHCHGDMTSAIVHEAAQAESPESMDCVRCHRSVGHGPKG